MRRSTSQPAQMPEPGARPPESPPDGPERGLLPVERVIAGEPGRLHHEIWRLAWPLVLGMVFQTANGFLDRIFIGRLGPHAVAAVGLGSQFYFILFAAGLAVSAGATALVARAAGAASTAECIKAGHQALWLALAAALACVALIYPAVPLLVRLIGVDPATRQLSAAYLQLVLLGVPALFLLLILGAIYRGTGDMRTPMLIQIFANLIHLAGDWILIFGNLGLPRLGVEGGALALLISQISALGLNLLLLRRGRLSGMLALPGRLEWEWSRRILRIGTPAAVQNFSRVLSGLVFTGILAHGKEGAAAVAALTIGLTAESIAFLPGIAYSAAAGTLTGQALGAGQPVLARRSAGAAALQGTAVMCVMGAFFWLFAGLFARLFTQDSLVLELSTAYLKIVALSEGALALALVLSGALNGAGETRGPALASIVSMWLVRLPLAAVLALSFRFGAAGAWWAMSLSTMLNGLLMYVLFRRDGWLQCRV